MRVFTSSAFLALASLTIPALVSANISLTPKNSIVHCIDPTSYCLYTEGDSHHYFVTNDKNKDAYGACENEHDGDFSGPCVFYNQNGLAYQSVEIGCATTSKHPHKRSYCVATLGDVSTDPNDAGATRFQCFGHATAAWVGQGDDTTEKGADAGVVFAKAKGDNLTVKCPHA